METNCCHCLKYFKESNVHQGGVVVDALEEEHFEGVAVFKVRLGPRKF
jgi:hypothetical protein